MTPLKEKVMSVRLFDLAASYTFDLSQNHGFCWTATSAPHL